jgi:hypothetical protein
MLSECERVVISLLLEDVFHPNIIYNAYSAICYLRLGPLAQRVLSSTDPHVYISFPIRQASAKAAAKKTPKASATLAVAGDDGWISSRDKTPRSKVAKKGKASNSASTKKSKKKTAAKKAAKTVVEIDSSSSESSDDEEFLPARRNAAKRKRRSVFDDGSSVEEAS